MLDLGRFPYIDATNKAVTKQTIVAGDSLNLTVKFNNTTDKNITLELTGATPPDSIKYTIVKADGSIVVPATNLQTTPADVAILKGSSVTLGKITNTMNNVGTYTIIVQVVDGTTKYEGELVLTVEATQADKDAAAAVVAQITALGSNPTKAAVTAANASYTALSPNAKTLVTNYATLKAFLDDIAAGQALQTTVAALGSTSTNAQVKQARAAYDALGALGKAEVTSYANLVTVETNLAAAKTDLANAIATAQTLYNTEKARLDTFTPAEINLINSADNDSNSAPDNGFTTYQNALNAFKSALDAAKAVDVNADATTTNDIATATTNLNTALSTFNTAKSTFDAIPQVIATGK